MAHSDSFSKGQGVVVSEGIRFAVLG
ncbi:hypothetical protein VTL71DRAFT_4999 [Oculimacula yallundae]|uniref:Uncharacterized protein n=1 Tax=Oculimacula yallundae TaxID=86028 RepID=A0ABR4BZV8_9HELO